jgi:hypothetical protein
VGTHASIEDAGLLHPVFVETMKLRIEARHVCCKSLLRLFRQGLILRRDEMIALQFLMAGKQGRALMKR